MKLTPQRNPAWHAEAARAIKENFGGIHVALMDATRRAVWLGLFLNYIKARGKEDGSIPHGMFGNWCEKHIADFTRERRAFYMAIGRNVMEQAKLPFSKVSKTDFSHPGKLPREVEPLIEGKTQRQLFMGYAQAKIEDDCQVAAVGRLKGQGGATKEQRVTAQQAEERGRLEALELKAMEIGEWLLEVSDDQHLGMINGLVGFKTLRQGLETALGYLRHLPSPIPAVTKP